MLITQMLIASSWEKIMSSVISPHSPDLNLLSLTSQGQLWPRAKQGGGPAQNVSLQN